MNLSESILKAVGGQVDLNDIVGLLGNGGLQSVVSQLQSGGLGDVVGSWISNGANLPVSPEQLRQALSPEVLGKLSQIVGGGDLGQLATRLPELVNAVTPNGQLGDLDLGGILGAVTGVASGAASGGGLLGNILGGLFGKN